MADDIGTYKLEKTITLNKLKPNEHHNIWVVQLEATLHKCLGIVLGNETNPTPMDDDGRLGENTQASITSWRTHARTREFCHYETALRQLRLAFIKMYKSLQLTEHATIIDYIKPSTITLLQYPAVDAGKLEYIELCTIALLQNPAIDTGKFESNYVNGTRCTATFHTLMLV
jgi:hypothetical protein